MDKAFLGKRIREQRKLQKLKQDQLAEKVGIGTVHLSEIERGNKTPSMETFIKIVNALNVPADIFLRDEVDGGKPYILNDITEKMKDLSPAQLKMVAELVYAALDNFANLEKKSEEN